MTTEQYSIGYDEGYQAGWNAAMDAKPAQQEPVAVYGFCPECGAKGVQRERRPDGNDKCANGHIYPSSKSSSPAQRTWVGLTDEEAMQICVDCGCMSEDWLTLLDAIEAKLKEKNNG